LLKYSGSSQLALSAVFGRMQCRRQVALPPMLSPIPQRRYETIMSTFLSAPAVARRITRQDWAARAIAALKWGWVAYMDWRLRLLAIDMLDGELEHVRILRP
jgi:hypothetical protein